MAKKVSKAQFKHTMRKRMVDVSQTKFNEKTKRVTGPRGKLFTGSVDMGGGRTQTYEKGRRIKVSSKMKGFGGAKKPSTGGTSRVTATPAPGASATRPALSMKERKALQAGRAPWKSGARRIAGSGSDGVNAVTSSGAARTSDSLMSTPRGVAWGSERKPAITSNRPRSFPGQKTRLQKDAGGQLRWVKVK